MVVFTCSHCGDSVKKNQVEKHYQFQCRNRFPALTCVDCLKDFNGDTHVSHTSCVTEEERYSAKGFVAKPSSVKGKKRQEHWVSSLRSILDCNPKLDKETKSVLDNIVQDSGVPQKKAKFFNYCNSKFSYKYQPYIFERVWGLLEKKKEELKGVSTQNGKLHESPANGDQEDKKRKRVDSSKDCASEETVDMCTSEIPVVHSESLGKKKKNKKHKKDLQDADSIELHKVADVHEENVNIATKKEKKKKKDVFENGHETNDQLTTDNAEQEIRNEEHKKSDESSLSKKEKKEKRKREKYEKQLLEIQSVAVSAEEEQTNKDDEEVGCSKKKKKKHTRENHNIPTCEPLPTVESESKKKKKRKDLDEVKIENVVDLQDKEGEAEVTPKKFNWEETVVKVLESKGELPLKRLEKKVVSEYMNSGAHVESYEKVIAKFNKKITKMPRVKVKKDVVNLVL